MSNRLRAVSADAEPLDTAQEPPEVLPQSSRVAPLRPLLVDERTACQMLSISRATLRGLTDRGEIKRFVIRGCDRVLYAVEELQRWVDERRAS